MSKTICQVMLAAAGIGLGGQAFAAGVKVADEFETAFNRDLWSLKRMLPRRSWIDRNVVRYGRGALAIRVKGNDYSAECKCQQVELRERKQARLNFGADVWYRFSFLVRGKTALTGSQRWVIGGWKQESDGSAFVAQRFDMGVFHITLETPQGRVLLASAKVPAVGFVGLLKKGILAPFGFVGEPSKYATDADVEIEYGANPVLPDPAAEWVDMVYHIRGGLEGKGLVEVFANGRFIARARGSIGVVNTGGPTQYFKIGHNRAPMPSPATLYFDGFHRGATRKDVE